MSKELNTLLTALYVLIDDHVTPPRTGRGRQPVLSDSELITLAVAQMLLGFHSERRWIRHLRSSAELGAMFPYLPKQPGYHKRLKAAYPLLCKAIVALATCCPSWFDDVWMTDATPVPCGASRETVKRSDLVGHAGYGYCASHSRYYWGLKLYLVCSGDGMPIMWCLANPKLGEREVVAALLEHNHHLIRHGQVLLADKGFAGKEFKDLTEAMWVKLLRPDRKDETYTNGNLGGVRQWIESVNQTLKGQLDLEAHGGRTPAGVLTRVGQRLMAMAAGIWHNWTTGIASKRSLTASTTDTLQGINHLEGGSRPPAEHDRPRPRCVPSNRAARTSAQPMSGRRFSANARASGHACSVLIPCAAALGAPIGYRPRRPRQLVDVPMPARCSAMQSSPAVSRVCGVNASLTLASAQSKMSDNARMTAARIANITISCRRGGRRKWRSSNSPRAMGARSTGRPGPPPVLQGPIRIMTWRSDRRWRFPWRTQLRAADGQPDDNVFDIGVAANPRGWSADRRGSAREGKRRVNSLGRRRLVVPVGPAAWATQSDERSGASIADRVLVWLGRIMPAVPPPTAPWPPTGTPVAAPLLPRLHQPGLQNWRATLTGLAAVLGL